MKKETQAVHAKHPWSIRWVRNGAVTAFLVLAATPAVLMASLPAGALEDEAAPATADAQSGLPDTSEIPTAPMRSVRSSTFNSAVSDSAPAPKQEFQFEGVDPVKELIKKGVQAHNRGDDSAAERTFREVLSRDPNNVHAMFNLGSIYQGRGDLNGARENFQQVLQVDPNDSQAKEALANLGGAASSDVGTNTRQLDRRGNNGMLKGQLDQVSLRGGVDQRSLQGMAKQDNFMNEINQANNTPMTTPQKSHLHLRVPTLGLPSKALVGAASVMTLKAATGVAKVGGAVALMNLPGIIRSFDDDNDRGKLRGITGLTGMVKPTNGITGIAGLGSPHNFQGIVGSPHNFQGIMGSPHNFQGIMGSPHNFQGIVGSPHSFGGVMPHNFGGMLTHGLPGKGH